jgi:hypothetical protein
MLSRRSLLLALAAGGDEYDRYGGYRSIRSRATGRFRVEKIRGRWMFITPEGHGFVALGANHIGKFFAESTQSGPLLDRFGGDRVQAEEAFFRAMQNLHLNAGEAYAPLLDRYKQRLPRIENIEFPRREKFAFDVFDPAFQKELHEDSVAQCRRFAGDPWVIGVTYVDLPIWNSKRVDYFRNLPPSTPGRRAFEQWRKQSPSQNEEEFLSLVAMELYPRMKAAVREGAPGHLFLGERFVLRMPPEPVVRAVGKHVDVFCTQALILSPHRPPEWQTFQADGYRHAYELTGEKPMLIIDWPTPFSLDTQYETDRGVVRDERTGTDEAVRFVADAFAEPFIIGLFICQLAGMHGNDRWFPAGRMKRTYLKDDGTPYSYRTRRMGEANRAVLETLYRRFSSSSR